LEKLGFPLGKELSTDFILMSLPPSYGNFILNYHMHGVEKGLNELCGMLKTAETDIKKGAGSSHVMAIQNSQPLKGREILRRRKTRPRIRSPCQTRRPRLVQLPMLNVFIVRKLVIGKETASCT
jgi:hypothetical protein